MAFLAPLLGSLGGALLSGITGGITQRVFKSVSGSNHKYQASDKTRDEHSSNLHHAYSGVKGRYNKYRNSAPWKELNQNVKPWQMAKPKGRKPRKKSVFAYKTKK